MNFGCLFPGLEKVEWRPFNLNEFYLKEGKGLDMKSKQDQVHLLTMASAGGKDGTHVCTYGGYQEDRSDVWACFYPPTPNGTRPIHLGTDFNNLPVNQPVHSLTNGKVAHIMKDGCKENGWGGRVIIQTDHRYVIYGHLDPDLDSLKVGQEVKRGQLIGNIGDYKENGGWFPHLHLQVMDGGHFVSFENPDYIDGYAHTGWDVIASHDPMTLFKWATEEA